MASGKVVVDIFVTDFRQWAACVYMVQAVRDLPQEIQAIIEIREWDMRTPDAVRLFKENRIAKLPSIAIAGNPLFESLIPDQEELKEAIFSAYDKQKDSRE